MKITVPAFLTFLFLLTGTPGDAQVSYGAAAVYGTRKIIPAYSGNALQVRRTCDNATGNIGFTSCGDLDTNALKTFVLAANPLSAISSTANAVYSLRKMYCGYSGQVIRIRSSAVGSPTTDIGFTTAGDLDTAALKTFVGTNSAFVTTWYDQSGNAYHATQTTAGNQPRIMNAGVIDRRNGKPAMFFNGSSNVLLNDANSMLVNNQTPTWNAVVVPLSPTDVYSAIVCWRYAGGIESALEYGPGGNWNTSWWSNTNYNLTNGTSIVYNAFQILTSLYNATSNELFVNGNLSYNNTGQSNTAAISTNPNGCAATGLRIGNDNCCGGRFVNGYIMEIVMAPTNFSTIDRQFLEWSQAQYYSVIGPVLTTLPASPASASVTIWYDQSGTAKDAVQATAGNQPRIVNAGIIEKNGSVPAISFAGFPQNLVAPLSTSLYPVTVSILGNISGSSSGGAFFKLGTSVNAGQAGIAIGVGNSGGTFDSPGTSVIGLKEWVVWSPSNPNVSYPSNPFTSTTIQQIGSGGMTTFLNGNNVPLNNSSNTVGGSIAGNLFIGGYTNSSNRFPVVKESEVIVFPASLSSSRRILLETQQAAYHAITISNNKYIPPSATSYKNYVIGVGRESATDSVSETRNTVGMGFLIGQAGSDFLKDNGDYLTAGINCLSTGTTALNLSGAIVQRWTNDWFLNITDVGSNSGNVSIYFDFSDYGMPGLPGAAANYDLLYRLSTSGTFSVIAGTSKSVVGDRIVLNLNTSALTNNAYYTIGTSNIAASPLPVELITFKAVCEDHHVNVYWATASQFRNKYFSVESTLDGVNFKNVVDIAGAGTQNQKNEYSFTDKDPAAGVSYYRLRQTNDDGTSKYYKWVEINCVPVNQDLVIYPNPNTGLFTIDGLKQNSQVVICNTLGLVVYDQCAVLKNQFYDLSSLADGIYVVIISNGEQRMTKKLIIQR